MIRASIVGASGYVGGELLRLLLAHPHVEVAQVTSNRQAGRFVFSTHPNLRGRTQLKFVTKEELTECDVLFLCLPHGKAAESVGDFADLATTVIDTSADFRLRSVEDHTRWYGPKTASPEWREQFVYGLPELNRDALREARLISGVGCNATAVNLALHPLAQENLIERAVIEVKVGSSEGGAKSSDASHHPERAGAVRSFAPVGHRHQAEMCQELGLSPEDLFFSATAIEMVRGVLATSHIFLREELTDKEVWGLYRRCYSNEPFVRIVRDKIGLYRYPEPKLLQGTNLCDIGFQSDDHGRRLVVISAIDNLMKGAAGSAVQSMNLARGFEEMDGLDFIGLHPI